VFCSFHSCSVSGLTMDTSLVYISVKRGSRRHGVGGSERRLSKWHPFSHAIVLKDAWLHDVIKTSGHLGHRASTISYVKTYSPLIFNRIFTRVKHVCSLVDSSPLENILSSRETLFTNWFFVFPKSLFLPL